MSNSGDNPRPGFKMEWRFDLDPPVADSEMLLLRSAADKAFGQRHLPPTKRDLPEPIRRLFERRGNPPRTEFLAAAANLPDPRGLLEACAADRRRRETALGMHQDRSPEDLER